MTSPVVNASPGLVRPEGTPRPLPAATNANLVGHAPSVNIDTTAVPSKNGFRNKITGLFKKVHLTRPTPAAPKGAVRYQRARNVLKDLGLKRIAKSEMYTFVSTPAGPEKPMFWNDYAVRLHNSGAISLCALLPGSMDKVQAVAVSPYNSTTGSLRISAATTEGGKSWHVLRDLGMAFRTKEPTDITEEAAEMPLVDGSITTSLRNQGFDALSERVFRRNGPVPLVAVVRHDKLQCLASETNVFPTKLALRTATFATEGDVSKWRLEFTDDARHDRVIELSHQPQSGLFLRDAKSTTYPFSRPSFMKK